MIFTETELRMADNFTPDLKGSDNANNDGWESEHHDHLSLKFQGGEIMGMVCHTSKGGMSVDMETSEIVF